MQNHRGSERRFIFENVAIGTENGTLAFYTVREDIPGLPFWLPFRVMTLTLIIQFATMLLGYHFSGYTGVIVGLAATDWLSYIAYAICFARLSLWQPELALPVAVVGTWLALLVYFSSN